MASLPVTPPSLVSFFIFTPKDVPEGREHEKLIYFWPAELPEEEKNNRIGLSEALINFTKTFSKEPLDAIHTEKHTTAIFEAEPDMWFVMTVRNPSITRVKDGKAVVEFKEHDINDSAMQVMVRQAYRMFKLFNGPFRHLVAKGGEPLLRQKLEKFFPQYITTLRIENMDLFNTFEGIHFLPVDKNVYLRIQCFINLAENTFPAIAYSAFLYRDHLVWSGLEQEETRILYQYVVEHLNPILSEQNAAPPRAAEGARGAGFVTGPGHPGPRDQAATPIKAPLVYLGNLNQPYHLIVYQLQEITCLFLVAPPSAVQSPPAGVASAPSLPPSAAALPAASASSASSSLSAPPPAAAAAAAVRPTLPAVAPLIETFQSGFYQNLGNFISNQVAILAPVLAEYHSMKTQMPEEEYRYIYFNHMNFAIKTTYKDPNGGIIPRDGGPIPREIMKILNDMHSDFDREPPESINEVLVRTENDSWIVGRKSDHREFYVIFEHKNSHLIEINEEVRRLSSTYFSNIFIID